MEKTSQYSLVYQYLLRELKNTVECLLMTQVANVWNIYGGLNRLHSSLDKIFKHGSLQIINDKPSYLKFIQGLEWLQPESSKTSFISECEYEPHIPYSLKEYKDSIWLYRSIENHSLSQKLSWLLSEKTHLHNCYNSYAFLCQENYTEAIMLCLRAVERNLPSLISEINPVLFLLKNESTLTKKAHKRCSSFPDNHLRSIYESRRSIYKSISLEDNKMHKIVKKNPKLICKLKPWNSMPDFHISVLSSKDINKVNKQCKTTPSTPVHSKKISPSLLKVDYSKLEVKRKVSKKNVGLKMQTVAPFVVNNFDIIEHTPPLSSSQSSSSNMVGESSFIQKSQHTRSPINYPTSPRLMEYNFLALPGEKDYKRLPKKSFIEDGGLSVLPMSTGYFPKPTKGQSLTSFLTSSQFARANAELDRENAHFSISEAIISAMEQIRCKRELNLAEEQMDESDPEIIDLKQRIRLRRREKLVERERKNWQSILSDGKTDTTTTVSPYSTSPELHSDSSSSDDVDEFEINQDSNLIDNNGLSLSMASLYSEADLLKRPRGAPDGASDVLSAEGVALSLISKFNEKQLPRASDLEWLVSEEDAPQALLPLPKSWPVSPDDSEDLTTPLRGTQEWAPPRPQIIFTIHKNPQRKELMTKQNFRCAGCGMRVAPKYASRFRYCHYLGRYFCTGCHTNQLALIPGRVLQKWDFSRYPVSTFSYRLLDQMYTDPLFRVFELNKNIGKLSKNLELCHRYSLALFYLKDFIFTCRFAESIQETLEQDLWSYMLTDPDVYSMEDLVNIRNGDTKSKLKFLVDLCCKHTTECKLCTARGFICEICNLSDVIFPWQMKIVNRCSECGTCYHKSCWKPSDKCLKCERIIKRKQSIAEASNLF